MGYILPINLTIVSVTVFTFFSGLELIKRVFKYSLFRLSSLEIIGINCLFCSSISIFLISNSNDSKLIFKSASESLNPDNNSSLSNIFSGVFPNKLKLGVSI